MANPFQDFIASEFLEQTPQASYLSSPLGKQFMKRSTGVQDPAKKRFFQESFQDIYQDYLGKLGAQAYITNDTMETNIIIYITSRF